MLSPTLVAALFAILSAALTVVMVACVVLWMRVRALMARLEPSPTVSGDLGPGLASKSPGKARSDLARRVDELAEKLRAVEARLAAVEAGSGSSSGVSVARRWGSLGGARRVDRGAPATLGGPTLIAVPSLSSSSSSSSSIVPEVAAELDRRFGAVWALADSGAATETLARQTGYPIGQVELILGLRRQILAAEASHDA